MFVAALRTESFTLPWFPATFMRACVMLTMTTTGGRIWQVPEGGAKRSGWQSKVPVYKFKDIEKVRTALDADPVDIHYGGSENLRRTLHPSEAGKAFILQMADRTIDLSASTEEEAEMCINGFRLLIAAGQGK